MSTYMKPGQAWLYDTDTNDIVGVKDRDGGEAFFGRISTDASGNMALVNPVTGYPIIPGQPFNVLAYGANIDGVVLYDVTTTNGQPTVNSATGEFTQADVGKIANVLTQANNRASVVSAAIIQVNSPTQAVLGANANATKTAGQAIMFYGTDNKNAINAANAAAKLGGCGVVDFPLGIIMSSGAHIVPNGVEWVGRGYMRLPNSFAAFSAANVPISGTYLQLAAVYYGSSAFVKLGDSVVGTNAGAKLSRMTVDCAALASMSCDMSGGYGCRASEATFIDGVGTAGFQMGPSAHLSDSYIIGTLRGHVLKLSGDATAANNIVYGAGAGKAVVYADHTSAGSSILGGHIYGGSSTDNVTAGGIYFDIASGVIKGSITAQGVIIDSPYGPAISVNCRGAGTVARSLSIKDCESYTNDQTTSNTYPFIKVSCEVGAEIHGLTISGNIGKGSWNNPANGTWTMLVDDSGMLGTIEAAQITGNVVNDVVAAQLYASGAAKPAWVDYSQNSIRTTAGAVVTG